MRTKAPCRMAAMTLFPTDDWPLCRAGPSIPEVVVSHGRVGDTQGSVLYCGLSLPVPHAGGAVGLTLFNPESWPLYLAGQAKSQAFVAGKPVKNPCQCTGVYLYYCIPTFWQCDQIDSSFILRASNALGSPCI